MGVLKELNRVLADFFQANNQQRECGSLVEEEFLCCCERARLAIKDFIHEGDATLHHCFLIAGDALCDLQWCWHNLADSIHGERRARRLSRAGFQRALFPLVWEIRLRKNQHRPSDDARNGSGSTAHQLPPGLNVDDVGAIEYLEDLGAGSQGMVYKARWPIIRSVDVTTDFGIGDDDDIYEPKGDLVAVKEVSSGIRSEALESVTARSEAWESLAGDSVISRSNLYCELDVLKTLHHPNIVELKGYTRQVRAQGKYGLVMELMNSSLADLIKSNKLSDLETVDTLLQVARGMHFLHMAGIMHRDLKPANILITELNYLPLNARRLRYVVAKLADFGLSKGLSKPEDLVADGAGCHTYKQGTSFYMAPEVREYSNNAGESCAWYAMSADVFSFGTTCFNVLTGEETPFAQEGHPLKTEEFYRMIKRGHLFDFKCERSKMALLVRQCWCFDPSERPTFLQICQILEDEKRQILCPTTPMSPSMSIDKEEEVRGYSSGARKGLGEIEHLSEIEYFHDLGSGAHEMCELGQKVHRAIWRGVHPVAVKEVSSLQLKDLSSCYTVLKMLNHPNVVELKGYTMLRAADRYGLVTDLMWCSFEDLIEKMPITDKRTSINLLLEVARGMEFLHSKGILHLGLKPASILIGPPHRNATRLEHMVAKITDFWFSDSRVDEAAGSHGYRQGDDFYMAPELYNFCKYSATKSADVFSFGTMCFNVLTKRAIPLEDSLQSQEFYSRIERGDVDKLLRTIHGESEMRCLVRACWCADADSRPQFVEICQILEMEKSRILELVEKSCSRKKQQLEELLCSVKVDKKGQIFNKLEEELPRNKGYVQELLRTMGYVLWMKLKVKLHVLKLEARSWKRRSSR